MKVSILIATFDRDFGWLRWCLRSIGKFATGFHEVVVAIPEATPAAAAIALTKDCPGLPVFRFHTFDDWSGKGFVRHMDQIIHADQICPDADFILHLDSDCIFTQPVTPRDYFLNGKPVLLGAPYEWIVKTTGNHHYLAWKKAVEAAIGGMTTVERMRRHPAVHYRMTYQKTRDCILAHTGKLSSEYIRTTRNEFPQTFCEFATLGEVAARYFGNAYALLDQSRGEQPPDKLMQFWSHAPMDGIQKVWQAGQPQEMVPLRVFERLLA